MRINQTSRRTIQPRRRIVSVALAALTGLLLTCSSALAENNPGWGEWWLPPDHSVHGGGIEWTIKDGIPYHVPTLLREVRDIVGRARETTRTTAP